MNRQICLTIAGSDSGGEAGIQADLQTFADFDCHGLSVITANTAQNPQKILSLNPVPKQTVIDQLNSLFTYFDIKFIKTGLLPSIEIMEAILEKIPENSILVTDPIIASTSGTSIMPDQCLDFFKSTFSKRIDYLTPNMEEAGILIGKRSFEIREFSNSLRPFYRKGLLLKGGHSATPGIDYFADDSAIYELKSPLVEIKSSHGTGCRISSAFSAGMSLGKTAIDSAISAKNYVYHALESCQKTDKGQWLICSPGKAGSLENYVEVTEL